MLGPSEEDSEAASREESQSKGTTGGGEGTKGETKAHGEEEGGAPFRIWWSRT